MKYIVFILVTLSFNSFASDSIKRNLNFELNYQFGVIKHGALDNGAVYSGTYHYTHLYGGTYPVFYYLDNSLNTRHTFGFLVKKLMFQNLELESGMRLFNYGTRSVIQDPFEYVWVDTVKTVVHYDTRFESNYYGVEIPLMANYTFAKKDNWSFFASLGGYYHRILLRIKKEYDFTSEEHLTRAKDRLSAFPGSANWFATAGMGTKNELKDGRSLIFRLNYDYRIAYRGWNRIQQNIGVSLGVEF